MTSNSKGKCEKISTRSMSQTLSQPTFLFRQVNLIENPSHLLEIQIFIPLGWPA